MQKYAIISDDMRQKILTGFYKRGERLPFETEIGAEYNASKMTVKRAMDILVQEGLILKKRGSGTFVRDIEPENIDRLNHVNQFSGRTAMYSSSNVISRVLEFDVVMAPEDVQEKLNCEDESFVYEFRRIRFVDKKPHVIEHTFMPITVISGLKKKHLEKSVYHFIEHTLGLNLRSVFREVTCRKATSEEAELLQIETGDPVVIMKQTGFLESGVIFEYTEDIFRSDTFEMRAVLQHKKEKK